jgi:hypothetical protein
MAAETQLGELEARPWRMSGASFGMGGSGFPSPAALEEERSRGSVSLYGTDVNFYVGGGRTRPGGRGVGVPRGDR